MTNTNALADGFRVRLVRARTTRWTAIGRPLTPALQTLRRSLCLRVLPAELRLSFDAADASGNSSSILRFFAAPTTSERRTESVWLSIRASQVTSVNVKNRLLRVALLDGHALTLCMKDADDAVSVAAMMMDVWGVEPLVETERTLERRYVTLERLTELYLDNPRFRTLVHQLHTQIESLTAVATRETLPSPSQ